MSFRERLFLVALAALFGVMVSEIRAEIFLRSTFEEYEESPWNIGWQRYPDNNQYVKRLGESSDDTQMRAHGSWSLHIKDDNSFSYANASHEFPTQINKDEEYMVEFYFWAPSPPKKATGNKIYLYYPTKNGDSADIVLTSYLSPTYWTIAIRDANGEQRPKMSFENNKWHKLQIHKHPDGTIDLYINGLNFGVLTSISGTNPPDKFLIGTEDAADNGEGFWDDFIITTVPDGEHPRLFFDQNRATELRELSELQDETPVGVSYKYMAESFLSTADVLQTENSFIYPYWDPDDYTFEFPYPYPPSHANSTTQPWTMLWQDYLSPRIQILAFAYTLTNNTDYANRVKKIMISVSNWPQWTDPDYSETSYAMLDTAHVTSSIAMAYDMIFDQLSNYEKMTIQNALLTLGIEQIYLEANYGWYGQNPGNIQGVLMASMGIAALAIYNDENLPDEVSVAKDKCSNILDTPDICGQKGGWIEGILYGAYATSFIGMFAEALFQVKQDDNLFNYTYLKEYPYWRLYNFIPGGTTDTLFNDSAKYNDHGILFLFASKYNNGYAQWFLYRVNPLWSEGYCIDNPVAYQIWAQFAPYVWLDTNITRKSPDELSGDYSPYGRHFTDIGWAAMRTGWGDNDKLVVFKSGPTEISTHIHCDNNNFLYGTKGKWFLADKGYGATQTTFHNVILIDEKGQRSGKNKNGTITKFYTSSEYSYVCGSATAPYQDQDQDTSLTKFVRKIVLVNDPGWFVVYDDVRCQNTTQIDWLLHTRRQLSQLSNNNLRIWEEDDYLDIRILLPDKDKLLSTDILSDDNFKTITVRAKGNDIRYLVLFYPYNNGETVPSITKISGSTMIGARIEDPVKDGIVMYSSDGNTVEKVEYKLKDADAGYTFNVLVDLKPITWYTIIVTDGIGNLRKIDLKETTSEGTLDFEVQMGGTRKIWVGQSTTLCGEIWGTLEAGVYLLTCDVEVPPDKTLTINPGVKIYFKQGYKIIAKPKTDGTTRGGIIEANATGTGDDESIWFLSAEKHLGKHHGMKLYRKLVLKNGGWLSPGGE